MNPCLDTALHAQLVCCQTLLDMRSYTAAADLLSQLATSMLKSGSTQTFLRLWQHLPEAEREALPALVLAAGDAWRLHDDWPRASRCYQRAQWLAEQKADPLVLGQALSNQALVCWQRGDVAGAAELYQQALRLIDETHPAREDVRSGYALVLSSLGRIQEAEALLQEQIRVFQRRNDIHGQRMTLHNLGLMVYVRRGDFQAAEAVLKEALHLAEVDQQRFGEAYLLNSLAYTLNWQRRAAEALPLSLRARALGEALAVPNIVAFSCLNQAQACYHQGELAAADRACHQARDVLHSAQSAPLQCDILLVEAQLQQHQSSSRARATALAALSAARLQGDQWMVALCLLQLAELHLALADSGLALAALEQAHTLFTTYEDRYHLLHCHLLAARLAAARGDWNTLGQHLEQLLSSLSHYQAFVTSIGPQLGELWAARLQHVPASMDQLYTLALASGTTFAALAGPLLAHPDVQIRSWTVRVLASHELPWSWTLLAEHQEAQPAVRKQIQLALRSAARHPLPMLEVSCLGGFAVRQGSAPIPEERWVSLHAQIVLVYLLLHGAATRDELIELLWPDSALQKTAARLRTTLHLLRKALHPPWQPEGQYVLYHNERYRLDPRSLITSDVQQFQHWITQARATQGSARYSHCVQALRSYGGPLLPGLYNEWVLNLREHLAEDWLWAQEEQIVGLLAGDLLDQAETHARHLIRLEPGCERGWQLLLDCLQRQGREVEMARMYRLCAKQLIDPAGIWPLREREQGRSNQISRELG